jgi:alpha-mannosidase
MHYNPIHAGNLKQRAELLLDQYGRTGSLLPHNVVLVPLGDDFRYEKSVEFDQQYNNYIQIMDFINKGDYNAEVRN